MVDHSKKKVILLITCVLLTISALIFALIFLLKYDADKRKSYESEASSVGLKRAKEECKKEGKAKGVCDSLTGVATTTECNGKTCWIVHANFSDALQFSSSIIVGYQDDNYIVLEYQRRQGTPSTD